MQNPQEFNSPKTTLAVLKGFTKETYVRQLAPEAKLIAADDGVSAAKTVIDGKADAFVADCPV